MRGWWRRWKFFEGPAIPAVNWLCCGFSISLARSGRRGILAPLGLEGLIYYLRVGKLEVTHFLGDDGALMLRFKFGYQPCLEFAGLLGIQITYLVRNIDQGCHFFVMTLFRALISCTASTTYVNGQLFTLCVADKFAWLLLNILGCAG